MSEKQQMSDRYTGIPAAASGLCPGCSEIKPAEAFFVDRSRASGLSSMCRECRRANRRSWYHERGGRAGRRRRGEGQLWNGDSKSWLPKDRLAISVRAIHAVGRAIKRGALIRGTTCEHCGATDRPIDAAHKDYSRPLDVVWLCRRCHIRWDRAEPKTKAAA